MALAELHSGKFFIHLVNAANSENQFDEWLGSHYIDFQTGPQKTTEY